MLYQTGAEIDLFNALIPICGGVLLLLGFGFIAYLLWQGWRR